MLTIALGALIFAFLTIKKSKDSGKRFWYIDVPFSLFFAWITAATVVNTFQWLSSTGVQIFGPSGTLTAAFFIIIAAVIGVFITLRYHEVVYGLVLVWAFWGVTVAHPPATPIILSTILATFALLLAIIWNSWSNRQRKNQSAATV